MDPSGSFVDEPLPPRRGDGADWLIPAAIVVAGLVLAIAVIMSRRAPSASSEAPFTAAPQTITQTTTQPIAPPPPVVVPSPTPVISAEDSAAQKTLEDVVAAARTIRGQTGSYAAVTSFELATLLPANSYRPPTEASEGATDVSISVTPTIFSAAVMSETGVCFWIRDFEGTRSTFDSGEPCTGAAAASAVLPAWPIPPSPSGTPSVTP
jgi:hypothetical protein